VHGNDHGCVHVNVDVNGYVDVNVGVDVNG
jgi:hypothetical protein